MTLDLSSIPDAKLWPHLVTGSKKIAARCDNVTSCHLQEFYFLAKKSSQFLLSLLNNLDTVLKTKAMALTVKPGICYKIKNKIMGAAFIGINANTSLN